MKGFTLAYIHVFSDDNSVIVEIDKFVPVDVILHEVKHSLHRVLHGDKKEMIIRVQETTASPEKENSEFLPPGWFGPIFSD